jgi:hypothetical protein
VAHVAARDGQVDFTSPPPVSDPKLPPPEGIAVDLAYDPPVQAKSVYKYVKN